MALRKNAKIELIKRAPIFESCPKKYLTEVAAAADEIDLAEGRELTRQGRPGREFFVLVEGEADVSKDGRKIATMKTGDFFGEISLLSNRPRTATVVTTTPVRVLVLSDRAFWRLLERLPGLERHVLKALAERLAEDE